MASPSFEYTPELINDLKRAIDTKNPFTHRDAANKYGKSQSSVQRWIANARHLGLIDKVNFIPQSINPFNDDSSGYEQPQAEQTESISISSDLMAVVLPKTRIHTLEALIEFCEVDTTKWEVERFTCNKWEVAGKSEGGGFDVEPLYQVKATFKPKNSKLVAFREEIEATKREWSSIFKSTIKLSDIRYKSSDDSVILECSIPDLHLRKLAWATETGWDNYDTQIAVDTFKEAVTTLIRRTSHHKFSKVLFIGGNDLFNADNIEGFTTGGTKQDVDTRYQKAFRQGKECYLWAINVLRQIAPVHYISCPGNHDNLSSWHLAELLECVYSGQKHITFDTSPTARKYIEFGKCLIGFTHGDKGKRKDYPMLMAQERREAWGRTIYREIHCGHWHTEYEELKGVKVHVLPSLCPPDAWHADSGYVGNVRSAKAFVWHPDEGVIGDAYYRVPTDISGRAIE